MKKLINILFLILIATVFIISCSDDDDDSTTGPDSNNGLDQSLVGTWVLTKIISPPISLEAVGIALTAVFNDNGSMELTSEDAEGTVTYTGTWSTKNFSNLKNKKTLPSISNYKRSRLFFRMLGLL